MGTSAEIVELPILTALERMEGSMLGSYCLLSGYLKWRFYATMAELKPSETPFMGYLTCPDPLPVYPLSPSLAFGLES